jgi:hypothetical protein
VAATRRQRTQWGVAGCRFRAGFSIVTRDDIALQQVQVALDGAVLGATRIGAAPGPCIGSISLEQSILIAEAEVGGEASSIRPDDDNPCYREVEVLAGETLWEVKLHQNGAVLEVEVSDDDD